MSTIFCNCSAASTGRMIMNRICVGLGCAVALLLGVSSASAQGTVKIGLINVLSGQFADAGIQLDNGVKTYMRSEEHTSELQSLRHLVCRLLLEKKQNKTAT